MLAGGSGDVIRRLVEAALNFGRRPKAQASRAAAAARRQCRRDDGGVRFGMSFVAQRARRRARPHGRGLVVALWLASWAMLGSAAVPALAAGWGVVANDGVHWLRTPDGQRFFSLGVNTVNGGEDGAKARAGTAYWWPRHYASLDDWGEATQGRLLAWGFNTAGGWSEVSPAITLPQMPEIDLGRKARLHWFDLFDPRAQQVTDDIAREIVAGYRHAPAVVGFFTDNEVGWWSSQLFLWYLARGWDNATKRVLWQLLHDHYGGRWQRLRADFVPASPGLDSFEALKRQGAVLKLRPGGQGIRVVGAATGVVAARYYELVHRAMRKAAPQALVLGDRLPLYYHQDAVLAQRGWVDVLSTNYNVDAEDGWVAPYYFEGLRDLSGAPVLVSEYFFAADDNRSGNRNNGHLMHVATQAQRAIGASAAMRHFAAFPNVVGVHWFQYADEPTGGRADGEDFNMGLVDIHDRPYEALTAALADANRQVPQIHAAARWTAPPSAGATLVLRRAGPGHDAVDGSLLDWKDKAATRLTGFETPKPYVPFGDVHLAWSPEGLRFFHIGQNYVDLDLLDRRRGFPLGETYSVAFTVDAGAGARSFAVHLAPRPRPSSPGRFELVGQLWRYEGGRAVERLDASGRLRVLDKLLPHIQIEGLLPAALLGVDALRPGQEIGLRVEATQFYRELTMTARPARVRLGAQRDDDPAAPLR
jgi:hypothetical protein